MEVTTIGILGLNRIGASLAAALQKTVPSKTIVGYDMDHGRAKDAVKAKLIDKMETNVGKVAAKADLLVMLLPIHRRHDMLELIGSRVQEHVVILDMSPGKGQGLASAGKFIKEAHYVGVMPVLSAKWLEDGREGLDLAQPDLFYNSVFCVMPDAKVDPQAVETAMNFGRLVGATPFFLDPLEYDGLAQGTTTLPSLVAAAMMNALAESQGWRDMLRFAGSGFALSTLALGQDADIATLALENREATLKWIDRFMEEMQTIRRLVHSGEPEQLVAMIEELNETRVKWLRAREKNEWNEDSLRNQVSGMSSAVNWFGSFGRGG
ncbi:MAG TPA: prephenate dehydrogenase/arogenate dehydrogenase family protein [Anaerolineae bacterium]|nr:prephenate dehydrogenase/arogenate dehydrogenase family protein [Anaerolineae bacterium]